MKETDYRIEKIGTIERWYDKKTNDIRKNIEYWSNGNKRDEAYFLNLNLHREDGPARHGWYKNGTKEFESYFINGKLHREDGPAYQEWDRDGTKKKYWLDGKEYSKEEYKAIMLVKKFNLI
jgi:antitoxin component YwqK of YwqJK toxin-antitoxin module